VYKRFGDEQDPHADPQLLNSTALRGVLLLAGLAVAFACSAGARSGTFGVNISLGDGSSPPPPPPAATAGQLPPGHCISESRHERTGAVVRVVCETGQFVSITPLPGAQFVGTHGGAYTYVFGRFFDAIHRQGEEEFATGSGTIASFRIYDLVEIEGPLEMLVSF
jgi:hypothetical protein